MADYHQNHVLLSLVFFSCLVSSSFGYQFVVGGRNGWVLNPSENYNQWAGRNRFQVNDTLLFKYKSGSNSVLVVNKDDYEKCNTANPIQKFEDGNSVFKFDRSGPFYFISGNKTNCDQGQKLIVVVLAVRTPPLPPRVPSPTTSPPSPSTGASPPANSPLSPPAGGSAPANSPLSPPAGGSAPANSPSGGSAPANSPPSPPTGAPAPANSPAGGAPGPSGSSLPPSPAGGAPGPGGSSLSPSPASGAPAPGGSSLAPSPAGGAPGPGGSSLSPSAGGGASAPGSPGSSVPGSGAPGSGLPGSGTPADANTTSPPPRSFAAATGTPSIVLISTVSLVVLGGFMV